MKIRVWSCWAILMATFAINVNGILAVTYTTCGTRETNNILVGNCVDTRPWYITIIAGIEYELWCKQNRFRNQSNNHKWAFFIALFFVNIAIKHWPAAHSRALYFDILQTENTISNVLNLSFQYEAQHFLRCSWWINKHKHNRRN